MSKPILSNTAMRFLGVLHLPASVGLLFLATKYLSAGPVTSGLAGGFLLAAAGAVWGKVDNDYPAVPDRNATPEEALDKKRGDMKAYAVTAGLLGVFMGALYGYATQEQARVKTLPEIDSQTVLRTETVTLKDENCKGGNQGRTIAIDYKGKEYRLQCPKAP
ncbi:MAG: hypothetical protein ACK4NR_07175 [Micavibrio sp.]